jgi:heterodisulfide reductase subunit A
MGPRDAAVARTGLYFCRCGPNLGRLVQLGELEAPAAWPDAADVATHGVLCSEEGRAWLAARIAEQGLDRVVVAACSPREHEATFRKVLARAGRSPWALQMVNLREQVEWIGGAAELATARAARLVRAAVSRVALHRPLPEDAVEVSADVLVVGGGAAGVSAALALARRDRKVILVERSWVLGGLANQLDEIFPDLECASCFMEPVLDQVLHHERIEVLTGAELTRVRGAAGRFAVDVALRPRRVDPALCLGCGACAAACPAALPGTPGAARRKAIDLAYPGCLPHASAVDPAACLRARGEACDLCVAACGFGAVRLDESVASRAFDVGAVVIATGHAPGEVPAEVGGVPALSSFALERLLHPNGPTGGKVLGPDGAPPRAVLLATASAGGDPDEADLGASELLKLAHLLRAKLPEARVVVAGGLERSPRHAAQARALAGEGVAFVASPGDAGPVDLAVLHAPPRPADGAEDLARLLRLPADGRGFLLDRAASPFEPTATRVAGVYVAGAAAGPRPIRQAIRDGAAAAGLVLASLAPGERRPLEPLAAIVDPALCGGCGVCGGACPFGAVRVERAGGRRRAVVEAVHCRGCGTCAAACPTGAASAPHFTRAQIAAEISALLGGG